MHSQSELAHVRRVIMHARELHVSDEQLCKRLPDMFIYTYKNLYKLPVQCLYTKERRSGNLNQ
jgi:hypothetical protein